LHDTALADRHEVSVEMPQHWRLVMHFGLGNSTAAVQVHTCILKGVQCQSMAATTSLPRSPSKARLYANNKDCVHKQLAL